MEKKMIITVEINGDRKEIVVRDSAGNSRHLKSVLVTGGGVEEGSLYLFGWGSCADLGWALAEGFRYASESPRSTDAFYQRVFAHLTRWIAKFHGWALEKPRGPATAPREVGAEDAAGSQKRRTETARIKTLRSPFPPCKPCATPFFPG